ncbi:MAG TPA: ATP-binding protein [Hyphomonadaceae bacterium]|jgi:two-component system osmolarity sensor histidine kinase EnvZ
MRLRDYTPRGYNARHILILIVPMMIFVTAMTWFFFNTHVQQVNTKLSRSFAQELALAAETRAQRPENWNAFAAAMNRSQLMHVSYSSDPSARGLPPGRYCCEELEQELTVSFGRNFKYAFQPESDLIEVRTQVGEGTLIAKLDRKRVVIVTAPQFIGWSVGFSLLLLTMSYLFLRNQVRSILQLSWAADAFGRGEDVPDFKPSGALEVRRAARSLIRMKNRIRRYTDQRTAMLAGVSHDLRTPLARLKLELALLPKEHDANAAKADIAEMEQMLDGYLAFARGEEGEQPVETNLSVLAQEASAHAAGRSQFEFSAPTQVVMRLRPLAMKRAIANLANNAADYGKKVRVSVTADQGEAVVTIEDDGPGIPPQMYEEAFRPFSRLDAARNQNVSGVGLGLTIARDTARAHGGDVTLGRSELGGLKATIRLPVDVDAKGRPREQDEDEDS